MEIYLIMCLNDVIGDTYYTDEEEVKTIVAGANRTYGGDFWYKTLTLECSHSKTFTYNHGYHKVCQDCGKEL